MPSKPHRPNTTSSSNQPSNNNKNNTNLKQSFRPAPIQTSCHDEEEVQNANANSLISPPLNPRSLFSELLEDEEMHPQEENHGDNHEGNIETNKRVVKVDEKQSGQEMLQRERSTIPTAAATVTAGVATHSPSTPSTPTTPVESPSLNIRTCKSTDTPKIHNTTRKAKRSVQINEDATNTNHTNHSPPTIINSVTSSSSTSSSPSNIIPPNTVSKPRRKQTKAERNQRMSSQYTPHVNRKHVKRGRGSAGSIQLLSNDENNENNKDRASNNTTNKKEDGGDDDSIVDPIDMLDSLLEETVGVTTTIGASTSTSISSTGSQSQNRRTFQRNRRIQANRQNGRNNVGSNSRIQSSHTPMEQCQQLKQEFSELFPSDSEDSPKDDDDDDESSLLDRYDHHAPIDSIDFSELEELEQELFNQSSRSRRGGRSSRNSNVRISTANNTNGGEYHHNHMEEKKDEMKGGETMQKMTNGHMPTPTVTIPAFDLLLTPEPSTISASSIPALPTTEKKDRYDNRSSVESDNLEDMMGTTPSTQQQHLEQQLSKEAEQSPLQRNEKEQTSSQPKYKSRPPRQVEVQVPTPNEINTNPNYDPARLSPYSPFNPPSVQELEEILHDGGEDALDQALKLLAFHPSSSSSSSGASSLGELSLDLDEPTPLPTTNTHQHPDEYSNLLKPIRDQLESPITTISTTFTRTMEMKYLQTNLKSAIIALHSVRAERKDVELILEGVQQELVENQNSTKELTKQLHLQQEQLVQRENDADGSVRKVQELRDFIIQQEDAMDKVQIELESSRRRVQELEQSNELLSEQVHNVEKTREGDEAHLAHELEQTRQMLGSKLQENEEQIQNLMNELEESKNQNDEEVMKVKKELEDATGQNALLKLDVEVHLSSIQNMESEVAQVRESMKEKEQDICTLEEKNTERIGELMNDMSKVRAELENATGQNAVLEMDLELSRSTIQDLESIVAKAHKDNDTMNEKHSVSLVSLSKAEIELEDMVEQNKNLQQEIESYQSSITAMKEEIVQMREDTKEKNDVIQGLTLQLSDAEAQTLALPSLESSLDEYKQQVETKQAYIARLEDKLVDSANKLQKDHAEQMKIIKETLTETTSQLETKEEAVTQHLHTIQQLELNIERDRKTLAEMECDMSGRRREVSILEVSLKEAQDHIRVVESQLETKTNEVEAQKRIIKDLEQEIKNVACEDKGGDRRLVVLQERTNTMESAVKEKDDTISKHLCTIENLKSKVEHMKTGMGEKENCVYDLSNELGKKSQDILNLETQVREAQHSIAIMEPKLKDSESQIEAYEATISALRDEIDRIQNATKAEDNMELEHLRATMESDISQKDDTIAQHQVTIEKLSMDLEDANCIINKVKTELDEKSHLADTVAVGSTSEQHLRTQPSEIESKLQQALKDTDTKEEMIKEIGQQNQMLQAFLEDATNRLSYLEPELEKRRIDNESNVSTIEMLESKLEVFLNKGQDREHKMNELEKMWRNSIKRMSTKEEEALLKQVSLQRKLDENNVTIERLESELAISKSGLEDKNIFISRLEQEAHTEEDDGILRSALEKASLMEEEVRKKEKEIKKYVFTAEDLHSDLAQAEIELEEKQKIINNLQQMIDDKESNVEYQVSTAEGKIKNYIATIETLISELEEKDNLIVEMEDQLHENSRLKDEVETAIKQTSSFEFQMKEKEEEIENLITNIEGLEHDLTLQDTELQKKEGSIEDLTTRLDNEKENVEIALQSISRLEQEKRVKDVEAQRYAADLDMLKSEMASNKKEKTEDLRRVEEEMMLSSQEMYNLQDDLRQKETVLESLVTTLEAIQSDKADTTIELKEKQNTIEILTNQLHDMEQKIKTITSDSSVEQEMHAKIPDASEVSIIDEGSHAELIINESMQMREDRYDELKTVQAELSSKSKLIEHVLEDSTPNQQHDQLPSHDECKNDDSTSDTPNQNLQHHEVNIMGTKDVTPFQIDLNYLSTLSGYELIDFISQRQELHEDILEDGSSDLYQQAIIIIHCLCKALDSSLGEITKTNKDIKDIEVILRNSRAREHDLIISLEDVTSYSEDLKRKLAGVEESNQDLQLRINNLEHNLSSNVTDSVQMGIEKMNHLLKGKEAMPIPSDFLDIWYTLERIVTDHCQTIDKIHVYMRDRPNGSSDVQDFFKRREEQTINMITALSDSKSNFDEEKHSVPHVVGLGNTMNTTLPSHESSGISLVSSKTIMTVTDEEEEIDRNEEKEDATTSSDEEKESCDLKASLAQVNLEADELYEQLQIADNTAELEASRADASEKQLYHIRNLLREKEIELQYVNQYKSNMEDDINSASERLRALVSLTYNRNQKVEVFECDEDIGSTNLQNLVKLLEIILNTPTGQDQDINMPFSDALIQYQGLNVPDSPFVDSKRGTENGSLEDLSLDVDDDNNSFVAALNHMLSESSIVMNNALGDFVNDSLMLDDFSPSKQSQEIIAVDFDKYDSVRKKCRMLEEERSEFLDETIQFLDESMAANNAEVKVIVERVKNEANIELSRCRSDARDRLLQVTGIMSNRYQKLDAFRKWQIGTCKCSRV